MTSPEMAYRRAEAALMGDSSVAAPMAVLRLRLPASCAGCALCVRERGHHKHYRCVMPPDVSAKMTDLDGYTDRRPEWCPLESVPSSGDLSSYVVRALQELEWLEDYVSECILCAAPDFGVVEARVHAAARILKDGMQLAAVGKGVSR